MCQRVELSHVTVEIGLSLQILKNACIIAIRPILCVSLGLFCCINGLGIRHTALMWDV